MSTNVLDKEKALALPGALIFHTKEFPSKKDFLKELGSPRRMEKISTRYTPSRPLVPLTAQEHRVAGALYQLCKEDVLPDLSPEDLSLMVSFTIHHDEVKVPGLDGYGPRFLAAKVITVPGLTSVDITRLLGTPGSSSMTVAGDMGVVNDLVQHPSCTNHHLATVLMEMLHSKDGALYAATVVEKHGPVAAKMASLCKFPGTSVQFGPLGTILGLFARGGFPVVEVYEQLRKDAGALEFDLPRVASLAELAYLTVHAQ